LEEGCRAEEIGEECREEFTEEIREGEIPPLEGLHGDAKSA